ncbi:MAG: HAMP domain-containing methyl-accepting chemotaxis protein [Lachnospiraceae bacterium]|nr:HAMP domain-containing methyl-accepting chemotaxis protein [Lachnospiraceae bacterium]
MYEKLNKYRIQERLVRGFVIASGVPALVAAVVLIVLVVVAKVYSGALTDYGFAQGDVGKAMTYFAEARSTLRGCIGYDDEEAIASMRASHEESIQNFTISFENLEKFMVSDANKQVYSEIASKLPAYWELDNEIIELGATMDRALCEEAQARAMNELMPLYDGINDQLISIMDIKVDRGNSVSARMTIIATVLVVVIAVIIVIAIWTSIRLGRYIAKNISHPLERLRDRLADFAMGDLTSPFPEVSTDDEVADIVRSANDMMQTLNFIIHDMEYVLGEMSDFNYAVRSKNGSRYTGEFRQIFESLKQLRDNMIETLRYIGDSSIQVSAGSGNLADSSQSLAEGATEQAGAVEELHATITTISDAAKNAAASAEESYQQSQRYADMADRSSADMKEMVEAMARINETSQKIGNIISEIENIASQTNLLSLNASIEAARAGEAGRGFAVVADQIRQLAEQSSKSAVDTRTLIEGAMQEIENGNKVADRAVASIGTVVEGIREVASSSKELSITSANQAATMQEAEEGVNQISDVIQTNAAVAEESSATSQELSAQAAALDGLIAKFQLPK